MRFSSSRLTVTFLGIVAGMGAHTSESSALQSQSCGTAWRAGDALNFDGVTANGRTTARVRIWSDSTGKLSYEETRREDSVSNLSSGSIWLDQRGIPFRYEVRSIEGGETFSQSIEQTGSTIVTTRDGERSIVHAERDGILVPEGPGPAVVMLLAQCAWHQPGRTLLTSRGDTVRLREAITVHLDQKGIQKKSVTLFVVSARGLNSYYARVWLDEQGHFFATRFMDGVDIVLPTKWKSSALTLLLAGGHAAEARFKATADSLGERHSGGTAIVNAAILDVERGRLMAGMSVFIDGSIIRQIQPDSRFTIPAGAVRVDAKGATLMPGLWDLDTGHDLVDTDRRSRRQLSAGVTSIRTMFADTIFSPLVSRRIDDGVQIGPRIFLGCPLDGWYPDTVAGAVPNRLGANGQVRNAVDVRRTLQRCSALGMRWVMLNDNLPRRLTSLAIKEAHRLGFRVSTNRLRGRSTEDLISAGVDQFEHVLQPVSSFVDHNTDSIAWLRHRQGGINPFWSTGAALPGLGLKSAAVQRVLVQMARKHIGVTTTLCVYPPINRFIQHDTTWDRATFAKLQEVAIVLYRSHVPVFAATDGACDLVKELELLHAAGFTAAELLRIATLDAARVVGQGRHLGSVTVGKTADLILVDGDPLADISVLRKIRAVIKGGVVYNNLTALRADLPYLLTQR